MTADPHVTDQVTETRDIRVTWNGVMLNITLQNGEPVAMKFATEKKVGTSKTWVGIDIPPATSLDDIKAVVEAAMEQMKK